MESDYVNRIEWLIRFRNPMFLSHTYYGSVPNTSTIEAMMTCDSLLDPDPTVHIDPLYLLTMDPVQ